MQARFYSFISAGLLLLVLFPSKPATYTLQEALDKELIELKSIAYTEDSRLAIGLKNPHKRKDIRITFPVGLHFASQDTSEQDQVIMRERNFIVRASRSLTARLPSYCTQASNRSPRKNSLFTLKQAPLPKAEALGTYLKRYRDEDYLTQHSVWVLTDNHDLRGLHHPDPRERLAILKFMSELTGKPIPGYTVRYRMPRAGQVAFNAEAISLHGEHRYDVQAEGRYTTNIYNEEGELVQKGFQEMLQRPGRVRFEFTLEARDLPKGKYVSRVYRGEELVHEVWMEG